MRNKLRGNQVKSLSGPATVSNESNFVTVSSTMGMGRRNETMMCKPGDLHKIILQIDGRLME